MSRKYLEQDNIVFPDFDDDFDENLPHLGKFGHMRLHYLKTARPVLYLEYKRSGELIRHLQRTQDAAMDMLIHMEDTYLEKHSLPEDGFMEIVHARNQARNYAEEIILHDLIYT